MAPKMYNWGLVEESGNSFEKLFERGMAAPRDQTSSASMKTLSIDEIHSSGPSLRSLEKLEVEQLTLTQGYDFSWATEILSTYGPKGGEESWESEDWEFSVPDKITDERSVGKYLEEVYFSRAICAGFVLFALATGLRSIRCPGRDSCRIVDQSTSGPSGRPDLQFERQEKLCGLVEIKTKRVCVISGREGRDVLDMVGEASLFYRDGEFKDLELEGGDKKATTILYQIWHQLLTRFCEHSVVANEEHFFLAIRRGSSLSISRKFLFSDPSSLSILSYFISHCFIARHPDGKYRRAEIPGNPSTKVQDGYSHPSEHLLGGGLGGGGSGHSRGHMRSDSETTIKGRGPEDLSNSNLKRWLLNIVKGLGHIVKGLGPLKVSIQQSQPKKKYIGDFPLRVIFTSSGTASTPLPFFPVGKALPEKRQLTLRERFSQYHGLYSVYRGELDGEKVVAKITDDGTLAEALRHEASIYEHLCDLQGFIIPTFLGLFTASGCYLFITTDCGESVRSFSTLTHAERQELFNHAVRLHEHGVLHNDLEPRNVVISGGRLKVIDFGMAELGHDCCGSGRCTSLQELEAFNM